MQKKNLITLLAILSLAVILMIFAGKFTTTQDGDVMEESMEEGMPVSSVQEEMGEDMAQEDMASQESDDVDPNANIEIRALSTIEDHPKHQVTFIDNAGNEIGAAHLMEQSYGVQISLEVSGLGEGAGARAIHIHETGDCTPLESFANAGGHFNPAQKEHGSHADDGPHAGDMPNITVDEEGVSNSIIMNHHITLYREGTEDNRFSVFDEDGSAIIIHAGEDDYKSQPSGAAGSRIACAVIK